MEKLLTTVGANAAPLDASGFFLPAASTDTTGGGGGGGGEGGATPMDVSTDTGFATNGSGNGAAAAATGAAAAASTAAVAASCAPAGFSAWSASDITDIQSLSRALSLDHGGSAGSAFKPLRVGWEASAGRRGADRMEDRTLACSAGNHAGGQTLD